MTTFVATIAPRLDRPVLTNAMLTPPSSFEMPPVMPLYVDNVDHLLTAKDCLSVTVFASQPKGCTDPSVVQTREIQALAFLDTRAVAGDFISEAFMIRQGASAHMYKSDEPITVCSGPNSDCFVSTAVVDIGVTFLCKDYKIHTVYLQAQVNPDSSVDLIIGLLSLNKYKFNILTPTALGFPTESDPPTYGLLLKPPPVPAGAKSGPPKAYNSKSAASKKTNDTILIETTPEEFRASPAPDNKLKYEKRAESQRRKAAKNKRREDEKLASYGPQVIPLGTVPISAPAQVGASLEIQAAPTPPTNEPTSCPHPTPAPDNSQRQPGSRRLLASVIATLVTRKDDTPRPGVDLNHTPLAPPSVIEGPTLDTVCDKPNGISISNEEIDSEKTDAFGPFLLDDMAVDPGLKN